jgi:hypothetical protein
MPHRLDLVGELVIAQSFVAQHPDVRGIANQFFTRSMAQLNRITKELQRTAMAMRMVPVGGTFQKMIRVVRDLGAKQQEQVHLVLSGEDTELDRTIVEEIADPLLHMIRNSVDHGIEQPDVRTSRGKPSQGTIHLRAFHRGGNVVIQIQDDGHGLNRKRILAKAVEKGLVAANAELTDLEIFLLIFAPGFSTTATLCPGARPSRPQRVQERAAEAREKSSAVGHAKLAAAWKAAHRDRSVAVVLATESTENTKRCRHINNSQPPTPYRSTSPRVSRRRLRGFGLPLAPGHFPPHEKPRPRRSCKPSRSMCH